MPASERPWVQAVRSFDLDDFASGQPGWALRYDQLSKGRFTGAMHLVELPGMRLVHETTNRAVQQRGRLGRGNVGIALASFAGAAGYFHGQRLDADSLLIGRSEELDLITPDDSAIIGIVVRAELLAEVWQRLYGKPWSAWLDRKVVVQARVGMAEHVRALHLGLMQRLQQHPALLADAQAVLQLRDAVLIEWLEAIPERIEPSELKSVQARRLLVQRACDFVLAQAEQPPTLLQVCGEVGASARKLDHCFRDVLGTTPASYLRAVRLNGARRDLKRLAGTAATVLDIASCWGFWHMGTFAADYRQQFGELPSTTLRAARSARPPG